MCALGSAGKVMTKKIYLEPLYKYHSLYNSLISNPPDGYQFIAPETITTRSYKVLAKFHSFYSLYYRLNEILPLNLLISYLRKFRRIPHGIDLIYSSNHLILRDEPWVTDLEYISVPLGQGKHLKKYKKVLEYVFSSRNCKKVICWYEVGKKTLLSNLDCTGFEHKIEVLLPYGSQKRNFSKQFNDEKIKLLFVGSANILGEFYTKGGANVIEAFANLNKRYGNLELVIRSDVPQEIRKKCQRFSNIRLIEKVIPWGRLEYEFKTADIFLLPAYNTPWLAMLDAMSYGLPVVTIDAWANSEIMEDGKMGFLVKSSKKRVFTIFDDFLLPYFETPGFGKEIRTPDPEIVEGLVEKLSILIENQELRRKMGEAARWEIEYGKFSLKKRNEKLKKILDEATIQN